MATQTDGIFKTFTAGGAITKFSLVKLSAANTVIVTTGSSTADKAVVGVAQEAAASGSPVNVRILSGVASAKVQVDGEIAAATVIYTGASGQATATSTSGTIIGRTNAASSAAGDVVEFIPRVIEA